jgi:hypothetical protein
LNLSLAADLIKNIQWLFWAISRVNTLPGSAVISSPQWSHSILHRGLAKILSWLDGSSFREHWSRHPLKYSYAFLTSILELFQVVVRWIQAVDDYNTLSPFVDAALPGVGTTALSLLLPHAGPDLQSTLDQLFSQWLQKWDLLYSEYHTRDSVFSGHVPSWFLLSTG